MRKKVWLSITIVFLLIICFAGVGAMLGPDGSNNFIVAVVSLAVALVAIYFSLRTYYSIDEVNAISRMDGNVMENPRYRPNIMRFVFRYTAVEFTQASDDLIKHMNGLFSKGSKQTGAQLADSVQEIADMMVLIPFFIHTNEKIASFNHRAKVSNLLRTMKLRVKEFNTISDGSCKLLDETVDLIEAVFAYQKVNGNIESNPSKLLEIRGSIFVNPITCILYNNYLGLYLLRCAKEKLTGNQRGLSPRELLERAEKSTPNDKSIAFVYCSKALEYFKRAKENVGDDMIWTGFICFNLARAEYLKHFLGVSSQQTAHNAWEEYINESIQSWMTSNMIIAEHFGTKELSKPVSYLQQALISQENKVRLFKIIIQMIDKQPLTDYNGKAWMSYYRNVTETEFYKNVPDKDPQEQTDILMQDIMILLKEL